MTTEESNAVIKSESVAQKAVATPRKRKTTAKKSSKDQRPKIAMFLDVDNAGISRENLLELLFYMIGKFKIELCNIYGYDEEKIPGISEIAGGYNLVQIGKMKFKPVGENVVDPRLILDAYECALKNPNSVDNIFVWCYPCDLSHLFEKITDLGVSTSTIDNPAFDCKNKFVSQRIKLYSPYTVPTTNKYMYGVDSNVSVQQSNQDEEKNENKPVADHKNAGAFDRMMNGDMTLSEVKSVGPVAGNSNASEKSEVAPPVLPRREIPEKITAEDKVQAPVLPKREIPEKEQDNIQSSQEEVKAEPEVRKSAFEGLTVSEMMEKAGFNINKEKSDKYEDTIGDL